MNQTNGIFIAIKNETEKLIFILTGLSVLITFQLLMNRTK